MPEKYLIDANIFFQSKNFWYQFAFCQEFWKWLEEGYRQGTFFSIKKVKKEISDGSASCPVKKWVANTMPGDFFLDDSTVAKINNNYRELMVWANGLHASGVYTSSAVSAFANSAKADAYLVAAAKHYNCKIVTHETQTSSSKGVGNIKIPNAASHLGVSTITLFDLLHKHAGPAFMFKP